MTGPRTVANQIREEVRVFLLNVLKIELNMKKTKITHLGSEYAKFLGYYIKVNTLKQNITSRRISSKGERLNVRKSTGKPKLLVPKDLIKNKLIEYGFANSSGFPKYVGRFLFLSDYEIIVRFNSILRGFMNFYNIAENRTSLNELVYILEYSLAHTLAAKHRLSLKKVFNKYGKNLSVTVNSSKGNKSKTISFDKPASLKAEYLNKKYMKVSRFDTNTTMNFNDPLLPFIYKINKTNILDSPCKICGSTIDVEIHHLKHLKNTKDKSTLIKVMSRMRRKTIPLCRPCHLDVHAGKYDGVSLRIIR